MRKIILSMLACGSLFAQPSCIQITDTLGALGASSPGLMNGTIDLTIGYTAATGGGTTVQSSARITVVNGALSYCAPPSTVITAQYSVKRAVPLTGLVQFTRYWTIPASGGPYQLIAGGIEAQVAPSPAVPIVLSQVIPSSQDGDVITTQNGIAVWATSLGLNYYSTAVTASTSIVVNPLTHRLPGNNFVVVCDGLAECGSVNVATDGTVTVRNNPAWSGTLYIVTTKASYSLPFASALNASSLWPVHHLQSVSAVACYDSAGNQFETGDTALTEHNLGISGLFANSFDITVALSASVPQTGRCVVLGN